MFRFRLNSQSKKENDLIYDNCKLIDYTKLIDVQQYSRNTEGNCVFVFHYFIDQYSQSDTVVTHVLHNPSYHIISSNLSFMFLCCFIYSFLFLRYLSISSTLFVVAWSGIKIPADYGFMYKYYSTTPLFLPITL